jgi:hypothetical protein
MRIAERELGIGDRSGMDVRHGVAVAHDLDLVLQAGEPDVAGKLRQRAVQVDRGTSGQPDEASRRYFFIVISAPGGKPFAIAQGIAPWMPGFRRDNGEFHAAPSRHAGDKPASRAGSILDPGFAPG